MITMIICVTIVIICALGTMLNTYLHYGNPLKQPITLWNICTILWAGNTLIWMHRAIELGYGK